MTESKLLKLVNSSRRTIPQAVELNSLHGLRLGLKIPSRHQEAAAQQAARDWIVAKGYDKEPASEDLRSMYLAERSYRAAIELLRYCLVELDTGEPVARDADELECLSSLEVDVLYGRLTELIIELSPATTQLPPNEISALVDELGKGQRPVDWSTRSKSYGRSTLLALLDSLVARLATSGGQTSSTTTAS